MARAGEELVGLGNSSAFAEEQHSSETITSEILTYLKNPTPDQMVEFHGINPTYANEVLATLSNEQIFEEVTSRWSYNSVTHELRLLITPSITHDIASAWMTSELCRMSSYQFLNVSETDVLSMTVGSMFGQFSGTYALSSKEPDFYIAPFTAQPMPSIVVECAWSERRVQLERDRDLWLIGGQPYIRLVLIFDFKRTRPGANTVRGSVEVWGLDQNGTPVMKQNETIFPSPSSAATQAVTISRGDLLAGALAPNRQANATYSMSINRLRAVCERHFSQNGLAPA